MSTDKLVRLRCDRCPAEVTIDAGARAEGWAALSTVPQGDVRDLGQRDLCPACYTGLLAWFAEAAPPPPAPPAARTRKPEISKPVRLAAYDAVEAVLRAQVAASMVVVREQPTSLIEGTLPDDAFTSVRPRAEATVDRLISDFGLLRRGR
ncbi:hypothetical protein [uncultured Sphingomonas sp.]|uniref:hypothetical protein n=1 Tax=uncultured Sphingomonas sp. TaxID=158754 RepID=UPI0025E0F43A|nr:hypothetical protein [uncultured Sphingomonas sp.]